MAVNAFVPKKSFQKLVHHALRMAYDNSQLASLFDNSFNNSFLEMTVSDLILIKVHHS